MKILGCEINWYLGFSNSPTIHVVLEDKPSSDELVYIPHRVNPTLPQVLWFAEKDGYASFYVDRTLSPDTLTSKHEQGFGGANIHINTVWGMHTLKGPWSSRPQVMNDYHPTAMQNPVVDVAWTEEWAVWERGHTYVSGNLTMSFLNETLQEIWGIEVTHYQKDVGYWTYGLDREKILGLPERELAFMRGGGFTGSKYTWAWSVQDGHQSKPLSPDETREAYG